MIEEIVEYDFYDFYISPLCWYFLFKKVSKDRRLDQ